MKIISWSLFRSQLGDWNTTQEPKRFFSSVFIGVLAIGWHENHITWPHLEPFTLNEDPPFSLHNEVFVFKRVSVIGCVPPRGYFDDAQGICRRTIPVLINDPTNGNTRCFITEDLSRYLTLVTDFCRGFGHLGISFLLGA